MFELVFAVWRTPGPPKTSKAQMFCLQTKTSNGVKKHIKKVYMQQSDEHYTSKELALYCFIFHGMSTMVCEFSLFLC